MKPQIPNPSRLDHAAASKPGTARLAALAFFAALAGCNPKATTGKAAPEAPEQGALVRVGSILVYETDLDHELKERRLSPTDEVAKRKVLDELVARAQLAEAALAAKLDRDPAVRSQIARALASRLKEQQLNPRLKEMSAPIPEPRLRELYKAAEDRFRSREKRQVAVLWLNPNGDPERAKQYRDKLAAARDWFLSNADLKNHPEQGFSMLSLDHSEHPGSRYQGGVVGWMEREGGMDAWTKAIAEIAFSLKEPGEVSTVIARPEGVFLVRYMSQKPAVLRPFETVSSELEKEERQRMRAAAEAEFDAGINARHPVQWLAR